jgi:hypothetical protein
MSSEQANVRSGPSFDHTNCVENLHDPSTCERVASNGLQIVEHGVKDVEGQNNVSILAAGLSLRRNEICISLSKR